MRTCCGRMLKIIIIRCVRNKLHVSGLSDVGSAGDRNRCRSLTAIESNLTTKKFIADALFLSGGAVGMAKGGIN